MSRLPRSGNAALAAAALIQGVLGLEFLLSGLSKFADGAYLANFRTFVQASPGTQYGLMGSVVRTLMLPNAAIAAQAARLTEVAAGLVLLVTAVEVARRRLRGPLGAPHAYEPVAALLGALAAVTVAGLSLMIYLLQGSGIPDVNPAKAFAPAITVELMIVPIGLALAWMQVVRYVASRRPEDTPERPASRIAA